MPRRPRTDTGGRRARRGLRRRTRLPRPTPPHRPDRSRPAPRAAARVLPLHYARSEIDADRAPVTDERDRARAACGRVAAHLEVAGRPVGVLEQDRRVVGVVGLDRPVGAGLARLVEVETSGDRCRRTAQPPQQHLVQRTDALDVVAAEPALMAPPLAGLVDIGFVPGHRGRCAGGRSCRRGRGGRSSHRPSRYARQAPAASPDRERERWPRHRSCAVPRPRPTPSSPARARACPPLGRPPRSRRGGTARCR